MKSPLSLKTRAITLLSQREHSPSELRRKLLRMGAEMARTRGAAASAADSASASASAFASASAGDPGEPAELGADDGASLAAEIDTLMAWLQKQGYLSEARFVESRINARASRHGSLRIKQELAQHGLALSAEEQATLRASEAARAKAVWQRKFGGHTGADDDPAQRARQIRFLTARGFAPDLVRRLLRGGAED